MKPLDVRSSRLNPKTQKSNLAHFGLKSSKPTNHCEKGDTNIEDIIENFLAMLSSSRKIISEVGKFLELILVLPATNATTSEKTFSKPKLIKVCTYILGRPQIFAKSLL